MVCRSFPWDIDPGFLGGIQVVSLNPERKDRDVIVSMMSLCRENTSSNNSKETWTFLVYLLSLKSRVLQSCWVRHLFHRPLPSCPNQGYKLLYSLKQSQLERYLVFLDRKKPKQYSNLNVIFKFHWSSGKQYYAQSCLCFPGVDSRENSLPLFQANSIRPMQSCLPWRHEPCKRLLPPSGASGLFRCLPYWHRRNRSKNISLSCIA